VVIWTARVPPPLPPLSPPPEAAAGDAGSPMATAPAMIAMAVVRARKRRRFVVMSFTDCVAVFMTFASLRDGMRLADATSK
jgi:hypothetical protein